MDAFYLLNKTYAFYWNSDCLYLRNWLFLFSVSDKLTCANLNCSSFCALKIISLHWKYSQLCWELFRKTHSCLKSWQPLNPLAIRMFYMEEIYVCKCCAYMVWLLFSRYSSGDTNVPFSLQSCSKPLTYCMVQSNDDNIERVHKYVGHEPSGRSFNEISLDYQSMERYIISNNLVQFKF